MNDVRDLGEYRARRAQGERPPRREPDFTLHAWLKAGEVDWTCTHFGADETLADHRARLAGLVDAAWQYGVAAEGSPQDERPALWWAVDNGGSTALIYQRALYEGANWRQALWLLRQWWRLTLRLARIFVWMVRGRR